MWPVTCQLPSFSSPLPPHLSPLLTVGAFLLLGAGVHAAEFSVRSETIGEAYRFRGRDGLFTITRTRLRESLSLMGGHTFEKPQSKDFPLRLSLNLALLLDHDFTIADREIDPHSPSSYVPLLRKTSFGLLRGYLNLSAGKNPWTYLRLGRQTAYDVTGMYAFDGVKVGFLWMGVTSGELSIGFETVPAFNLSALDFSSQGISWSSREGLPEGVHPEIIQPRLKPMVAASAKLLAVRTGSVSIGYRRSWTNAQMEHVSFERLSWGLVVSDPVSPLSAKATVSFDLLWMRVGEAAVDTHLDLTNHLRVELDYVHFYPSFDSSSIFNVFHIDPFDETSLALRFSPVDKFSLRAGFLVRVSQWQDEEEAQEKRGGRPQTHTAATGGMADLLWKVAPLRLAARIRMVVGGGGTLATVEVNPHFVLLRDRLEVRLGGGAWYLDDPLRRGHHATTGWGTVGASWTFVPWASLAGTVNLYGSRVSGLGASTSWVLTVTI